MAWRRPGDKPLSEPMMVSLLTHICVTRPQWVNTWWPRQTVDIFRTTFSNAFSWMKMYESIEIPLKIVAKGSINNTPAFVQIMTWRRGNKPLSETMMLSSRYMSLGLNELIASSLLWDNLVGETGVQRILVKTGFADGYSVRQISGLLISRKYHNRGGHKGW